jgi:hypothetical protein
MMSSPARLRRAGSHTIAERMFRHDPSVILRA